MVVVGGRGLVGYGKYDLKLFLADVLNICSTAAFAYILQVRIVKNQTHLKYHLNTNIWYRLTEIFKLSKIQGFTS